MPSNENACAICAAEQNALLQVFTVCKDLFCFFLPSALSVFLLEEKGRGPAGAMSGAHF